VSLRSSFPPRHACSQTHASLALGRASRAACLLISLVAAAPLAAQQAPAANANAANKAGANAPAGVPDANAAARAANDRLRGVSREESLLGGPAAHSDPYRSALDAADSAQTDLMRAERVPNPAMKGNGYAPLPPAGGRPAARAAGAGADAGVGGAGAGAGAGAAGNAAGGGGPPATAPQAAQSLYRDPFNGPAGAAQQIYHAPW
jgi:hypothetical protein